MLTIFGITAFLIFLYFMYPVWLTLLSPGQAGDRSETKMGNGVTLILLSYNGQQYLEEKINFLLKELPVFQHYELLIVDDNSQDGSKDILDNFRNTLNIRIITKSEHKGIPHTMNLAVEHAQYEHIIFCDQRQDLSGNILQRLVAPLYFSNIGAVSACISDVDKQNCCSRLRKFENFIKSKESRTGNLVGVYGPLYAIKKECYSPIPEHIILDDLYLSLKILGSKQIRILEDCRIFDDDPAVLYNYKRITRYLHGFLQLIREKSLLGRLNSKQLIMLLWHKYLRLLIPFLLFLSYLCAGLLISKGIEYLVLFGVITAIGIISLLPVRIHSGLRSLIRMNILYLIGLTDFFMKTGNYKGRENKKTSQRFS